MNVIVDTNILVSAVLKDRDPELVIQFVVDHPKFERVASQPILAEYKEVLSRPRFRLTQEVKNNWFTLLDEALTITEVNVSVAFATDPDDAIFLACAIAVNRDFLITGDADLFRGEGLLNTAVVRVARFKDLFCDVLES